MSISWGGKRKLVILTSIVSVFAIILSVFIVNVIYNPASCADGKQNQGEAGRDCGGPCSRLCENEGLLPVIHWQRAFPLSSGNYNAVAYVENKNLKSGAINVPYLFKLYDEGSILIAERAGAINLPPNQIIAVFEPNINTGYRPPERVVFQLEESPEWTISNISVPDVKVIEQSISEAGSFPLLTAKVVNLSKKPLTRFDVVAILYDDQSNARIASKTVVDDLSSGESATVTFSWPVPFDFSPARIEILPRLYPGINYK